MSSPSKFRILLLNSMKFMGGGETGMIRIGEDLNARGHHCLMAARPDSPLQSAAREAGLETHPLAISGDLNPILLWRLWRLIRECRVQIVLANTARDIRVAGMVSRLGGTSVVGLHQVDRAIKNKWNYRLTFNHLADVVVVNSLATQRTLKENNVWLDSAKVEVIPHGIDPIPYQSGEIPELRSLLDLKPDAFLIGFVGRLSGQKGISVLMDAMERIAHKYADAHLVIAGVGPWKDKIRRLASEGGYTDRIHLLGFRCDIPALMQAFDMLVMPSIWEGFGLVLVEGMAAGLPCVASDTSSLPEIIQTEISGLLVSPGDVEALVLAIGRVKESKTLQLQLANAGRLRVQEIFTVNRMLESYEQLFEKLVSNP